MEKTRRFSMSAALLATTIAAGSALAFTPQPVDAQCKVTPKCKVCYCHHDDDRALVCACEDCTFECN